MVEKKNTFDKENIETILALSPMQESMLFQYLNKPDSSVYFEQLEVHISASIDFDTFKNAWLFVIKTNEMLRTLFRWERLSTPIQVVLKNSEPVIQYYDLTINDTYSDVESILELDKANKFDLNEVPFRVTLCKLEDNRYTMIVSFHHILFDGWSMGIIVREFYQAYDCFIQNKTPIIKKESKFSDYIKWLKKQNGSEYADYWRKYLEELQDDNYLFKRKEMVGGESFGRYTYLLTEEQIDKINNCVRRNNITISAFIFAAWGILLRKYKNSSDIIFGTTVSGRPPEIRNINNIVGLFINTIPLRVRFDNSKNVKELLKNVNGDLIDRKDYESSSLADIKTYASLNSSQSFFDTIVVVENYPIDDYIFNESRNLKIESYTMHERTDFDLTLEVRGFNELVFVLNYKKSKFEDDIMARMAGHLANIMRQMSENDQKPIEEIEIITGWEKRQILEEFNNTTCCFQQVENICGMFEEQVQKSPDHVALIHNQKSVTYKSLNRRANILSRYIMRYIESQQIVGILCNNSIEMVVGIIAVLKAGCAYLPIEPSLPIERIEYMLKDSSAKVLLVDQNTVKRSNELEFDGQIIMLEEESCEDNVSNTDVEIKPDSLAYIIYTSGTTGVPKGVMINHSSIANAILWRKNEYSLNEGDTVLQLFSYAFDGFLTSLFTPIVSGSSVVIVDNEHVKDVVALKKHIITNKVTHFICVPSLFYELIDYMEPEGLVNIRIVTLAGEKVLPALLEISIRKAPHIELVNEYGPTENSVVSTVYRNMKAENPILIGKPISNVNAYIVNIDNNLLPIGIPGEICLFGKNLARGYLNNDELTNSKFLQMPFLQGRKVYKTGDMGRWISDGNIDYLGRTDNQVKIRGYRIEIEEIEKCLLKHISIKNAVVDVRKKDNGSYYICAFYLAQNELDVHELKLYLKKELPEYMIPEVFVKLDYMPLTSNGKIDRNALPDSVIKYSNSEQIVEAETETEKVILNDWKEVLELDNISINDNFFDIGGNSILLMRVHAKLDKRYPGIFKIADFFSYPNIYQLSQYLKSRCETLIQKETVEWIEFPQSFFADIQEKKSRMYSIDLEKSLIERLICLIKDKNINFNILLLSALMYVLKELSGKNLIVVYKIRNNKLIPIKIDFELLESFEDLFNKVMVESENMENAYNLDVSSSFNLDSNKPQNVVTILFNEMPQDYRFVDEYSIFDLILCYKNISDKYELVFEDSGRIDKNSIKKLVNTYMELLNIISNSY